MKTSLPLLVLHIVAVACALQNPKPEKGPAKPDSPKAVAAEKPKPAAKDLNPAAGSKDKSDIQKENKEKSASKADDRNSQSEHFQSEVSADDEKAIRKLVDEVESAFNDHDAKAFAALFAQDAEIVNIEGIRIRGQDTIEDVFGIYFEANPEAKLDIQIHSLRPLTPTLILEHGTSRVTNESDETDEVADYTVIYSKVDDRWIMVYARDSASREGAENEIQDLAFLIGDWIDESSDGFVATTYRWAENRRFILGQYSVHAPGYPETDGVLRIGWDPQAKQLRTWMFDSNGGFASGLWSQSDSGWMIKMTGVMADGTPMSATNYLKQLGDDHLSCHSVDRTIGSEKMSDGDELVIVRHPPKPETLGEQD